MLETVKSFGNSFVERWRLVMRAADSVGEL